MSVNNEIFQRVLFPKLWVQFVVVTTNLFERGW